MSSTEGWTFSDSNAIEWQSMGDKIDMKVLGIADGKMIAMFRFGAGYVGGPHHHEEPEFSYLIDGDLISHGVSMASGHAYAAQAGTDHNEFSSPSGCTLVSVFKAPG